MLKPGVQPNRKISSCLKSRSRQDSGEVNNIEPAGEIEDVCLKTDIGTIGFQQVYTYRSIG